MSLKPSQTKPVPQYNLGIITSKCFDAPAFLSELLDEKRDSIAHIYTNGASDPDLVSRYAREHGITHTIYPIVGGKNLPWSVSRVVDSSDAVYIIADEESKSAKIAAEHCEQKKAKAEKFRYRVLHFEPVTRWKTRVFKAKEILACATPDDEARNLWMKSVGKALDE